MAKSRCYFDRYRIGTTLVDMQERIQRMGFANYVGIDRVQAGVEHHNPNFAFQVNVMAAMYNPSWTQRGLHAHFRNLHRALMDHADTYGKGWLTWVDSDAETTLTSNTETAGSNVQVEVANVSALSVVADDYVLFIPPASASPLDLDDPAEVCLVTSVGVGSITVDTLANNLPSGSTVYRVFMAYDGAVFVTADLGTAPEQAQDHFRFLTSWQFDIHGSPVMSASYGYSV